MNWNQLVEQFPLEPITITMNRMYGSGGAGGTGSFSGAGGGGGGGMTLGAIPPVTAKGTNGLSVLDVVHSRVQGLRHLKKLDTIWPDRYYVIAASERAVETLRHEYHLSPLEIHPAPDMSYLCGLDRQHNYVILGPGFLDSSLFRGSFQNPLATLDELRARFGDHLLVLEDPARRTRSEMEVAAYKEEMKRMEVERLKSNSIIPRAFTDAKW